MLKKQKQNNINLCMKKKNLTLSISTKIKEYAGFFNPSSALMAFSICPLASGFTPFDFFFFVFK